MGLPGLPAPVQLESFSPGLSCPLAATQRIRPDRVTPPVIPLTGTCGSAREPHEPRLRRRLMSECLANIVPDGRPGQFTGMTCEAPPSTTFEFGSLPDHVFQKDVCAEHARRMCAAD